jgi:hypothetical protein
MATTTPSETLTASRVFADFLRVPKPGSRALVPLNLHSAQRAFVDAYDERDASGQARYSRLAALWLKKAGKSTTGGGLAVAELVGGSEADREVIIRASDLVQAKSIIFASAVRFVRRHPFLSKHIRILQSELVYRELVTDARTGGRHTEEHVARAVAGRDAKSLHGTNATLTIFDELWTDTDYAVIEALAPSAARLNPRTLIFSYVGLRSQQREGVPIFDLWQQWKAGDDASLFISYLGGANGWKSVPWISERFIEQQRKQFAAVPSKFKRLWLNEWAAGDEDAFLTAEEIADAVDPTLVEPAAGDSGAVYTLGVDLGLKHDYAAAVVTHLDEDGRVIVDAIRYWIGTRTSPVDLTVLEDELVDLASRFRPRRTVFDFWQAALLAARLEARHISGGIETVTFESGRLDAHATMLKSLFVNRQIRVPQHPEFVEQLETIVGEELKRRDRIRFREGQGAHDDLIVALCLSAEAHANAGVIGGLTLPASFTECWRQQSVREFWVTQCYLTGGDYFPHGCASCAACRGHQAVTRAALAHGARTGVYVDAREFYKTRMRPNDFIAHVKVQKWWYS